MKYNFDKLKERITNTLNNTDLERIRCELQSIKEPTIVTGVGGSSVVRDFTSKVLNETNNIIATSMQPRDLKYINLNGYKNVLACSYSGDNYGVDLSFDNDLNHYLLTGGNTSYDDVKMLYYELDNDKERSFISLSSTIIPCAILYDYYLFMNNKDDILRVINTNFKEYDYNFNTNCDVYEIFSGIDTEMASKFLESTFIESGLCIPIVHDKYDYCHGRSTLSTTKNNIAIYFNCNTNLDKLMIDELPKYYKDLIVIDTNSKVDDNFELLNKIVYLAKYVAEKNNNDLSNVNYSPIAKKLYKYKGEL